MKVKKRTPTGRFLASARPLHGSNLRTVIGSLQLVYARFKDLFSIFLRDFNDATPLHLRSKDNIPPVSGRQLTTSRQTNPTTKRGEKRNRDSRGLSVVTILSIKGEEARNLYEAAVSVPRKRGQSFNSHPFTRLVYLLTSWTRQPISPVNAADLLLLNPLWLEFIRRRGIWIERLPSYRLLADRQIYRAITQSSFFLTRLYLVEALLDDCSSWFAVLT